MKDKKRTKQQLMDELMGLRRRLSDYEVQETRRTWTERSSQKAGEPLQTIFQKAKGAMFVMDSAGQYVDVNPAGCKMTGYTRKEILSSDVRLLLSPADAEKVFKTGRNSWRSGGGIPECRIHRKDGSEVCVEITIIPFSLGKKSLMLWLKRDVTDLKQSREALERAKEDLERTIDMRGEELLKANQQLKREVEDRKRAEEELERTKNYLENIIENSVDAIGIVDKKGKFILWNRRAAEIYGYQSDELAGKSAFDLYENPKEVAEMLRRLRRDGVVREYEIRMKKKDGSIVPMDISISMLKDEHGRTIGSVCVARDLSERKMGEEALKRARDELSRYSKELERQVGERTREITGILKYTPAIVYIKDKDGHYSLVNSRYEELFAVRNEDIRGKSDYDLFPVEVADQFRTGDTRVLTEGRPCQVEERIPQDDGIHIYLSVKFPLYDEQGKPTGVCGISTDITELKKAQDKLRRLSGSIMAGQEKERTAIARELHDELGQVLTALRMDAVWLLKRLKEKDARASDRAQAMCDLIDKTIDEVRSIALRLRPGVLDDLGLTAALEWYTTDFEERTGIVCVLKHSDVPKVENIVATAAYRIVQEALTNVARHTSASHVDVTLQRKEDFLTLAVVDNGGGFNVADFGESEGLGLAGMRERASLAGGILEIRSRPGKGTQVYCRLPLSDRTGV
jgi:PAS domain S-box-containing protein